MNPTENTNAFGGPGIQPRWTSSAKTGVGTALSDKSHVWFTLKKEREAHKDASDKENARLIVSQVVLDTFNELKMAYPKTTAKRRLELKSIRKLLTNHKG